MQLDVVLKLKNVGKAYSRYAGTKGMVMNLLFPYRFRNSRFTAVQPLSLEITRGECVGIMGVNGSGKSTLLEMIAGTVWPTEGSIWAQGKIAALLELGSWINVSDSGRENIYTAGYSRGMSRAQIEKQLPGIIEFAEIGDFIDQPVSTYSTGMVMRLAFASCIYLEADILLLDEIFAVGDAYFAQKCISHLQKRIRNRTVLLVSHDTNVITSLCSRALLLDHGKLIADGSPREISERYLELCYGEKQQSEVKNPFRETALEDFRKGDAISYYSNIESARSFGEGGAEILEVNFVSSDGVALPVVCGGEKVCLKVRLKALKDLELPSVGFVVRSPQGIALWGDVTVPGAVPVLRSGHEMEAVFRFVLPRLENGTYSIGTAVSTGKIADHRIQIWSHNALIFKVNSSYPLTGAMIGLPMESIDCREILQELP